jgi:hypothetical protein
LFCLGREKVIFPLVIRPKKPSDGTLLKVLYSMRKTRGRPPLFGDLRKSTMLTLSWPTCASKVFAGLLGLGLWSNR